MAFGLKGYHLEHPSAAAELDTHTQPMLPPVCWLAGEINLPKSYPGKQVLVLGGLWPRGTSCWVHAQPAWRLLGLHLQRPAPPRQKRISVHGWSPPWCCRSLGTARGSEGAAKSRFSTAASFSTSRSRCLSRSLAQCYLYLAPQPLHGTERPGGKAKEVKLLWGRNDTTRL